MLKTPFFSILIPTKNRHQLIQNAIQSVLIQSFTDYELIVVDNNEDDKTENVIREFENEKIKYIRTGNLNMPDNWEFAFEKSSGEYITVLTDRMFYASENILDQIHDVIQKYKKNVVTWRWSIYNELENEIKGYDGNNKIVEYNSEKILEGFLMGGKDRHWFNVTSPKGLNSSIPRQIYKDVINKYGRLFYHVTPDFTSCFILLNMESKIIHIEDGLVASGGHGQSNGINAIKDKKGLISYFKELTIEMKMGYKFTPIKVLSVFNIMYNDLFFISDKLNWGLNWEMVNKVEYYSLVYGEIKNNIYEDDKEEDIRRWREALILESREVQKSVKRKIKEDKKNKRLRMPLLRILKKFYSNKKVAHVNRLNAHIRLHNLL